MINIKYNNIWKTFFGGEIYRKDYDAHLTMGDIASRIASDLRFEKMCRQNEKLRELRKNSEGE